MNKCDGGYACPAVEHIEGCFTGEGDPYAVTGLYIGALREENQRLRNALAGLLIYARGNQHVLDKIHAALDEPRGGVR